MPQQSALIPKPATDIANELKGTLGQWAKAGIIGAFLIMFSLGAYSAGNLFREIILDVMRQNNDALKQNGDQHREMMTEMRLGREMQDKRNEQNDTRQKELLSEIRDEHRRSVEKFDKTNDAIKAAVEEIRKIKAP